MLRSESGDEEDEIPETLKSTQKALDQVTAKVRAAQERKASAEKELSLSETYAYMVSSTTGDEAQCWPGSIFAI
jgi:hypothetical protein